MNSRHEFETKITMNMQHRISIMSHGNPNVALPTSHTCFFSIDIPRYSSYDNLKNVWKNVKKVGCHL